MLATYESTYFCPGKPSITKTLQGEKISEHFAVRRLFGKIGLKGERKRFYRIDHMPSGLRLADMKMLKHAKELVADLEKSGFDFNTTQMCAKMSDSIKTIMAGYRQDIVVAWDVEE